MEFLEDLRNGLEAGKVFDDGHSLYRKVGDQIVMFDKQAMNLTPKFDLSIVDSVDYSNVEMRIMAQMLYGMPNIYGMAEEYIANRVTDIGEEPTPEPNKQPVNGTQFPWVYLVVPVIVILNLVMICLI